MATEPNVVFVTIDAIRADHVGYQGYDRPTTPTIDRLADSGLSCTQALANGIPTYYSFKSLLGGIRSLGHSRDIGVPSNVTTIAEAFDDRGYDTAGFNAGNPWLTREYGYDRGFGDFQDFITDGEDEPDGSSSVGGFFSLARRFQSIAEKSEFVEDKAGLAARAFCTLTDRTPLENAETVTDRAVDWLDQRSPSDGPFFLWIHYMDPHYPWVPRNRDIEPFTDESFSKLDIARLWHKVSHVYRQSDGWDAVSGRELDQIRDLYDAEIRRVDDSIDRLLTALERNDADEGTVVTVVGDHGTELNDHGGFSHGPETLYDEVVRVPLVFAGPGIPEETMTEPTSLLDVPPTLLERATPERGVEGSFAGQPLFDHGRSDPVTEVVYDFEPVSGDNVDNGELLSTVNWPWKLVVNRELGTRELYNLERDPGEHENVASEHETVVSTLESTIDSYRERTERENETHRERRHVRDTVSALKRRGEI